MPRSRNDVESEDCNDREKTDNDEENITLAGADNNEDADTTDDYDSANGAVESSRIVDTKRHGSAKHHVKLQKMSKKSSSSNASKKTPLTNADVVGVDSSISLNELRNQTRQYWNTQRDRSYSKTPRIRARHRTAR